MSIAAMADNRLLRTTESNQPAGGATVDVPEGAKVPGVDTGTLNSIVQWIPIETIGAYVFLQQLFLNPLTKPSNQALEAIDYSARWHVWWVGVALTVITIPLYTAVKAKAAKAKFKLPLAEALLGTLAFVLWAAALPDSPFDDWSWWSTDYGVAAITISALLINPIATLLNLQAQWGKAVTTA